MKKDVLKTILALLISFLVLLLYTGDLSFAIAAWITPVIMLRVARTKGFIHGFLPILLLSSAAKWIINRGVFEGEEGSLFFFVFNAFLALVYCLPLLADKLLHKRLPPLLATLIYPSALALVEFINAQLGIGTWGVMTYSQFRFPEFMQTASLIGIYGMAFVMGWFASIVNYLWEEGFSRKGLLRGGLLYGLILTSLIFYGFLRLELFSAPESTVRVAAVTNHEDQFPALAEREDISQHLSSRIIIDQQLENTRRAVSLGAKIVVWNEWALVLDNPMEEALLQELMTIAIENKVYLLPSILYVSQYEIEDDYLENKNYLITPEGEIAWEYLKSHPIPVAELPHVRPGDQNIPFHDSPYGRLGTVICFDADFPDFMSQAGRKDIDILLVPGYDYQGVSPLHGEMASVAAVQNGFSMLRSAAFGQSAIYDWNGTMLSQLDAFSSPNEHIMIGDIPTERHGAPYSKIGYLLPYVLMVFMIGAILFSLLKRKDVE